MLREPDLVIFQCESCGSQSGADARMGKHLLPWKRKLPIEPNGICSACGGDSWVVSVVFGESSVDLLESAAGIALAATAGVGFVQSSTSTNRTDYPDISSEVVAKLNESPSERMQRVAVFAATVERERLRQRGARECASCGVLFVPIPNKPWSEKGFCSKMCKVVMEGESAVDTADDTENLAVPRSSVVRVQCAAGHQFDVPISFRGLRRRCPECGCKTDIPGGDG